MNKKQLLLPAILAGAITVVFLLRADQPSPTPKPSSGQRLEGSWTYNVEVTGVPPGLPSGYKSLVTFDAGGGLVQTAWTPPTFSFLTSLTGVSPWTGHGQWARSGEGEFTLTVLIPRFDSTTKFIGLSKARATITLDATGNEASGRFAGDIFDAAGNLMLTGVGGTVHATRVQVEAPE